MRADSRSCSLCRHFSHDFTRISALGFTAIDLLLHRTFSFCVFSISSESSRSPSDTSNELIFTPNATKCDLPAAIRRILYIVELKTIIGIGLSPFSHCHNLPLVSNAHTVLSVQTAYSNLDYGNWQNAKPARWQRQCRLGHCRDDRRRSPRECEFG